MKTALVREVLYYAVVDATIRRAMAKKKETPKFTYTGDDVDLASADGFLEGMAETHSIVFEAIEELQKSIENVQAFYYLGDVVGKKTAKVEELQTVIDALTHLKDVFQEKYDEVIEEHSDIAERMRTLFSIKDLGLTIE
jgi:uncharacterized coiled-coil DUF342 family protein